VTLLARLVGAAIAAAFGVLLLSGVPAGASDRSSISGAEAAVVQIIAPADEGSGFAIGNDRFLTNAHVVKNNLDVQVKFQDGTLRICQVVTSSSVVDLAIVHCASEPNNTLKLATHSYAGEQIVALGHPFGGALRVTEGTVTDNAPNEAGYIVIDAPLDPGNSGGPVIDAATDQVIGVASAINPDDRAANFAIPVSTVTKFVSSPPSSDSSLSTTAGQWNWGVVVLVVFGIATICAVYLRRANGLGGRRRTRMASDSGGGDFIVLIEPVVILHGGGPARQSMAATSEGDEPLVVLRGAARQETLESF
jgi:hypothetical protein